MLKRFFTSDANKLKQIQAEAEAAKRKIAREKLKEENATFNKSLEKPRSMKKPNVEPRSSTWLPRRKRKPIQKRLVEEMLFEKEMKKSLHRSIEETAELVNETTEEMEMELEEMDMEATEDTEEMEIKAREEIEKKAAEEMEETMHKLLCSVSLFG